MERLKALLAQGAEVSPANTLPPIFFALRSLNAPAVKVLLEAGACLDTPLVHPWLDHDDEGEIVVARAGTTARQFYARFEKDERA